MSESKMTERGKGARVFSKCSKYRREAPIIASVHRVGRYRQFRELFLSHSSSRAGNFAQKCLLPQHLMAFASSVTADGFPKEKTMRKHEHVSFLRARKSRLKCNEVKINYQLLLQELRPERLKLLCKISMEQCRGKT